MGADGARRTGGGRFMNAGETITIKRLAEQLGVSVRTVRRWISAKDHPLPCYKPTPRTILIRRADFDAWVELRNELERTHARR